MDLKEVEILGDSIASHWYYRSKAKALHELLGDRSPRHILDIGAGSAFFSRELLRRTQATEATCVDISYESDWDALESGKPIYFRRSASRARDADCVLLMDVLEHVDDDVEMLRTRVAQSAVGARFVVSVPAFRFLWSEHDEFLEHRRRYTLRELESTVRAAGLHVQGGCYFFAGVFPIAAVTRLAGRVAPRRTRAAQSQLRKHSDAVNALLTAVCSAEVPFARFNRMFGLSAFCVASTAPA